MLRVLRFILRFRWVVSCLFWVARRSPYSTIRGSDGSLYMERFWLVGPSSPLRHALPLMRFHVIHREDKDRDPHDHPWAFRSFVLRGSYRESQWVPLPRSWWQPMSQARWLRVSAGHFRRSAGEDHEVFPGLFHKITAVLDGPVLTLCVLGEKQDSWGFLTEDGVKVPWRDYLGLPSDVPEGFQP